MILHENLAIEANRMSSIYKELSLHGNSNYTIEEKVECLVNHLCSQILHTNKCYRIPLYEFPLREILLFEELPMFTQSLMLSLKEANLKVEDEGQGVIKVECSKKLKTEQLPALSSLQSKILKLYSHRDDVDEIAKALIEQQKLTHQEYEELQIVRHYEF